MLSDAQRKEIFTQIPSAFTIQGEPVTAAKRYGNQFVNDVFPAIVLAYPNYDFPLYTHPDQKIKVTEETTDTFTFATGTNNYLLTISPADIIREVKGYLSGRLQKIAATNYTLDTGTNEIQWTGPTFPDDTTLFTVLYHHKLIRIFKQAPLYDLLSINVYSVNFEKAGGGEINGILVSQSIAQEVKRFLQFTFQDNDIVLTNFSNIADLDDLAIGEYTRRRQFDCWTRHHEIVETTVEDIESVQFAIESLVN